MCRLLRISRAAYYKHIHKKPSRYEMENELLDSEILQEYTASKGCYGAPKIQKSLFNKGINVSIKRVQRRMKKLNIRSIVVKKWKPSCPSKNKVEQKENIINGNFFAETINKKWLTDITYLYTLKDGWCYLASVFDCFSAKIVGWHMSKNIDAELSVQAVKNAINNQNPDTKELIIHSDLGSQYTSNKFENYLKVLSIKHSYSKKGYPYDNAPMESFHSCFKKEDEKMNKYFDFNDVKLSTFEYIESWYNRRKIHSRIGYMTPQDYEDLILKSA